MIHYRLWFEIMSDLTNVLICLIMWSYRLYCFSMFLLTGHSTIKVKRTMYLHGLLIRCMNHVNHGLHDT